ESPTTWSTFTMNDSSRRALRAALQRRIAQTALVSGLLAGTLAASAQAATHHAATHHVTRAHGTTAVISHRTLVVTGTAGSNRLALRLRAHHPQTLQVDLGDNGSSDFEFDRHRFNAIRVTAGAGDDTVRLDESNGQF